MSEEISLSKQGEAIIGFVIPEDTKQKVLSLTVKTYYSKSSQQPMISTHSLTIIDLFDFKVIFYPEMSSPDKIVSLVANVP